MAIKLNKEGLTQKQIETLEPLMSSAASYERKIQQKKQDLFKNPAMDYDQEKRIKDQIAGFETKHKELTTQINAIMNARNVYNQKLDVCRKTLEQAIFLKNKWGF